MSKIECATFAGGCFWCMIEPFDSQPGIEQVISGYTGGKSVNPTYEEVCTGTTGHVEAVQILFDSRLFPYEKLLDLYWQQIDPTDAGGQFRSRGPSYQTAIFYHTEKQRHLAEESKRRLEASGKFNRPIVTKILPAAPFFPAEEEHQNYYKKNPDAYASFKEESGRAPFIRKYWKEKTHR